MKARVWLALDLLLCYLISTISFDVNQIQVPTADGISGVFLVQTKTSKYSFNATTAKEVCEAIQMRIAKKNEVDTANRNGLQTCRFGWIEEQVAVIPRVDKNENCGKGKVGVSVWRAEISKNFDVFCYNTAGLDKSLHTTSSSPQATIGGRSPSTIAYSTETYPSSTKSTSSTNTSRSHPPNTSTPSISSASLSFQPISHSNITDSSQTTPISHSPSPSMSKFSPSSSHSFTYFLHLQTSNSSDQYAPFKNTTVNRKPVQGSKTLTIILLVVLLLMIVGGAAWYLKMKRGNQIPSWSRMRPKLGVESEMLKYCISEQTSKCNNNQKCNNIILQIEQDPDSA